MKSSEIDIHLRVYHRAQKDIILLWSTANLTADHKDNVKIICSGSPMKFGITEHTAQDGVSKPGIANDTMICVIDHATNGLKANAKYTMDVILGGIDSEPIMKKIVVLEVGVLPSFDKDKKSARVHLMAWDYVTNSWVKVPAIKNKKYGYAIPVVQVPNDYDESN